MGNNTEATTWHCWVAVKRNDTIQTMPPTSKLVVVGELGKGLKGVRGQYFPSTGQLFDFPKYTENIYQLLLYISSWLADGTLPDYLFGWTNINNPTDVLFEISFSMFKTKKIYIQGYIILLGLFI